MLNQRINSVLLLSLSLSLSVWKFWDIYLLFDFLLVISDAGKGDPYCVLTCGRTQARSNTAQGKKPMPNYMLPFFFLIVFRAKACDHDIVRALENSSKGCSMGKFEFESCLVTGPQV